MTDPDIVTRLRESDGGYFMRSMFTEAADEIVRLRAELAEKDREIQRLQTECTRLATRNAVLVCEIDEAREVRDALYRGEG